MERKNTILIVDDDPGARDALEALLFPEGYALKFAHNGTEALLKASQLTPDVILLDVMMPEMDGFEVCQRLRTSPFLAEVPIIMITALDDRDSRLRGIEAGADEFVSKPFDRLELRTRIRTIVRLNRYHQLLDDRVKLERAHADLERAYDETLQGWSLALELRDHETQGHSNRVTEMTLRLAERMDMPSDQLIHVRRGALLHDIGKIGIPDSVLHKNGPLSEEEWQIMRRHPVYAYELLFPIVYLRPALNIPYYHHEHWDGSGYPHGLAGEHIPIEARIFAIVDVWDALLSQRPYRAPWPEHQVYAYLREKRGFQFDPRVVDVFLTINQVTLA